MDCISINTVSHLSTATDNYTVSPQKTSKIVLSELRQISTNFDNFWHKDGQDDKIMWGALIFHLT